MLTKEIKAKVLKLNPIEKIHLAELLLDSLDKTDEQIEALWVQESESRYQAYKEGRVKGIPLEQVRARYEK